MNCICIYLYKYLYITDEKLSPKALLEHDIASMVLMHLNLDAGKQRSTLQNIKVRLIYIY